MYLEIVNLCTLKVANNFDSQETGRKL